MIIHNKKAAILGYRDSIIPIILFRLEESIASDKFDQAVVIAKLLVVFKRSTWKIIIDY